MNYRNKFIRFTCLLLIVLALSTCSGGGSGGKDDDSEECVDVASNSGITPYELLNPKPCKNGTFGRKVEVLPNGNVVVSVPYGQALSSSSSAIHLFNPLTQELVKSYFSKFEDETFYVSLPNSNLVIVSPNANENGIKSSGSVMLVDGQTGNQIGNTIAGSIHDILGFDGIVVLTNNNFVIPSPSNSENNGSAMLIDGNTGEQVADIIASESSNSDRRFSVRGRDTVALENGNFVVASPFYSVAGSPTGSGSVRLFDGATGAQIDNSIVGDNAGDFLGSSNVKDLGNGNFVIASPEDRVAGVDSAGSVILVDGSTGLQIENVLSGDDEGDSIGTGISVLPNGNFVVFSNDDDHNGIRNAGTVRLFDGATGILIGDLFTADSDGDILPAPSGSFFPVQIYALPNANFVIVSQFEPVGGKVDAGSVRLVSGKTGMQIGSTLVGELDEDRLGTELRVLKNNNFVVVSRVDRDNRFSIGLVRLVDGETGLQIGNAIAGNPLRIAAFQNRNIPTLPNGNYVVSTPFAGADTSGTVVLVDGVTGNQIGETIKGDNAFDRLGSGGVFALSNNNFVIISSKDNVDGKELAGSIQLVDGVTSQRIGQPIVGSSLGDFDAANIVDLENSDFYILSLPIADFNGLKESGFVGLINKSP